MKSNTGIAGSIGTGDVNIRYSLKPQEISKQNQEKDVACHLSILFQGDKQSIDTLLSNINKCLNLSGVNNERNRKTNRKITGKENNQSTHAN